MKIFLGADHRGYALAQKLQTTLTGEGHDVSLVGSEDHSTEDDYVDFAARVGKDVAENPESRGVVICGSGVGMDIAANKINGVRASLGYAVDQVTSARNDDDINVLALGADFTDEESGHALVHAFLQTPFDASERRVRRLEKITALE
jgi:RpiB/LacA/LacB family sugar-phosphate isomerase